MAAKRIDSDSGPRYYEIPDGSGGVLKVPSVTTCLGALAKPQLVPWAAKVERELVIDVAADLYLELPATKMNRMAYVETLMKRIPLAKAHQVETEKAFEIGRGVHAMIEHRMREMLGQAPGPVPELRPEAALAYAAWQEWAEGVDFHPRHIEEMLWSVQHGYAGTTDVIADILVGGRAVLAVGDWKSSKAGKDGPQQYPEHGLQVAAYGQALVEMGHAETMPYGFVVSFAKTACPIPFRTHIWTPEEMSANFEVFRQLVSVWKWQQAASEAKKEKKK